jgi:hypothetical protein
VDVLSSRILLPPSDLGRSRRNARGLRDRQAFEGARMQAGAQS